MPKLHKKKRTSSFYFKTLLGGAAVLGVAVIFANPFNSSIFQKNQNKTTQINQASLRLRDDVNLIAQTYEKKSTQGNFTALKDSDFSNGKVPRFSQETKYQGLLSSNSDSFSVCTPLDPKDKDINCFDRSQNTKCYCRHSKGGTTPTPIPTPNPSDSPLPVPTDSCPIAQ